MYFQSWSNRRRPSLAMVVAVVVALQGCAAPLGGAHSGTSTEAGGASGGEVDSGSTWWKGIGCGVGALAGLVAAKALAAADAKRLKLSSADAAKRERGYMIAFALGACPVGAALGGSIYAKLSAEGRKERERALKEAVAQGRPQRYGDPTNPNLQGTVTPGKRYQELAANRECKVEEDVLAENASKDAIFIKWCRSLPNGDWGQVTT